MSCSEGRWGPRYRRGGILLGVLGGLVMLVLAAAIHRAASFPLLVLGTWWTAVGLLVFRLWRRTARQIDLADGLVTFVFPGRRLVLPVADMEEVRRSRGDPGSSMPIRIRTRSDGVVKAAPRMRGFVEVVVQMRLENPSLDISGL